MDQRLAARRSSMLCSKVSTYTHTGQKLCDQAGSAIFCL
jgi:hypothetical protein